MSDEEQKPGLGGTVRQSAEALAASKDLSVPPEAVQHAEAPKIAGYVLVAPIGRGAFAQVWKAWQVRTRKWVAVKVFTQKGGVNWLFLQREVERLIRLDKHPHIVSLLDADLAGETPYYVMDYMAGGSLERFVDPSRPAPAVEAARWMEEICQALSYVHAKGLIHCDLKPANVLLDEEGRVRVADFGQSRIVTESTGALGTLFYMAPEQAMVAKAGEPVQPDVRWDVYGLGTTMYAILTGKVPHGEEAHRSQLQETKSLEERLKAYREIVHHEPLPACDQATQGRVDLDLSAVVGKCARADSGERHPAVAEVLDDLEARRDTRPVSPLAHRRGYKLRKFLTRNRALVGLAALAGALLVAATIQILRERRALREQLAYSIMARAHQFVVEEDYENAASYYAESNRMSPSRVARQNALTALASLPSSEHMGAVFELVRGALNDPSQKAVFRESMQVILRELWPTIGHRGEAGEYRNLPHPEWVYAAAFSPDGNTVVTASGDGAARLWIAATGQAKGKAMRHGDKVFAVAFSPDGRRILTGSRDKTARLWNAETQEPLGKPFRHEEDVSEVAFSQDGKTVLTSGGMTARLWDAGTGEPLSPPLRHPDFVQAAAFSPDGARLITASSDTARLWDGRTGAPVGKAMRHAGSIRTAAFTLDGRTVLTGGEDKRVRFWDARTGDADGEPLALAYEIDLVALSPAGDRVVTASRTPGADQGFAHLWDLRTRKPVGKAMRHADSLDDVAFSPDGRTLLTACGGVERGYARLWDAETGEPLGKVLRHKDWVEDVAFSPDGRSILTTSHDKTVRLYDVPWLYQAVSPQDLLFKTQVASLHRVNARREIEPIPTDEWYSMVKTYVKGLKEPPGKQR